jgi:hypothetical protein
MASVILRIPKKEIAYLYGHKFCSVVDDATFAIGRYTAEHAFHPHTYFDFVRTADDLCGHTRPFIEFHDGKYIRGECLKLFICRIDDGMGNNRTKSRKLVINNPATPSAVGTEGTGREEMPLACFALCPNHVVPLGDFSPESCNGHR